MRELGGRVIGICHEKAHTLVGGAERGKMAGAAARRRDR